MYSISVEHTFAAAHAIVIAGARERVHGHNWHVTAVVEGSALDADGLLCDFHTLHAVLKEIVAPFENADFNATPPFDRVNPTAELIARHIADGLAARLDESLRPHARVASVRITESPGCATTYYRPR